MSILPLQPLKPPADWDEHRAGILPAVVFCTDLGCWCHGDQRKLEMAGHALLCKALPTEQAADIRDGIVPIAPEIVAVDYLPYGWVRTAKEAEQQPREA